MSESDPKAVVSNASFRPADAAPAEPARIGRRTATAAIGAAALAACADDAESPGGGGGGGTATSDAATTGATSSGPGPTSGNGSPTSQASSGSGGTGGQGSGSGSTASGEGGTGGSGQGGTGGSGGAGEGGSGGGGGEGGAEGDACAATSDLTPAQLLANIDTFVILCMENRSFDHYLGSLKLVEGRGDVDGLDGTETNPDGQGGNVGVFLLDDFQPDDPPHGWDQSHAQFDGGLNDGFVTEYGGTAVMGYHVREQIPITYALADVSAICDQYFASVMGPTWPNRFYLHGATSEGETENSPVFGFTPIWDLLDDAGLSGTNYCHSLAWASGGYFKVGGISGIESFFDDAADGSLPNVSIIDPEFFGSGANDDHPDHHIFMGQALIASVYRALAASPQWGRSMLIVTYDEHGGFFDHVPPPAAADGRAEFAQYGFRVPTLVTGPFVRRGCAVSNVYDHTSILKTIAVRFGLSSLTERMAAAEDLSACIEPWALQHPHPPVELPAAPVPVDRVFAAHYDPRVRPAHHTELWDMAERGEIPAHLDRRAEADDIARRVLEIGARLGAVRLIRG